MNKVAKYLNVSILAAKSRRRIFTLTLKLTMDFWRRPEMIVRAANMNDIRKSDAILFLTGRERSCFTCVCSWLRQ